MIDRLSNKASEEDNYHVLQFELVHEQLPLPVPCYDLLPVIELTLGPHTWYFGYSQLPWVDGRWVQDLRTYSPQYSWPAITSNSNFMGSSCSPQSELGRLFLRLAQGYPVATRCSRHCIMCVAPDIRGTCWPGVILAFLPVYYVQTRDCSRTWAHYTGQSRLTNITGNKGCVRYPT